MKLKNLLCNLYLIFIFLKLSCTQDCPTREPGRRCKKSCTTNEQCKGNLKRCVCDGKCGMSCINPNVSCPELSKVENGYFTLTRGNNYSSTAQYICNNSYVLIGDNGRQCQFDRTWSGSAPTCQRGCITPGNLPHAVSLNSSPHVYLVGSNFQYRCHTGFVLNGITVSCTCLADYTWSCPLSCDPLSCKQLENPTNGYYVGDKRTYGQRVKYYCNSGYEIDTSENHGSSSRNCDLKPTTDESAEWTGVAPQCNPIKCEEPPIISEGNIKKQGSGYLYNSRIEYVCSLGTIPLESTPIYRTCNANGTWGDPPTCMVTYSCDFEDPNAETCGYSNTGWTRSYANKIFKYGGYIVKTSFSKNATLTSQSITASSESGCLSFDYKMPQSSRKFQVKLIEKTKSSVLWSETSPPQSSWTPVSIDVTLPANPVNFTFQVSGTSGIVRLDSINVAFHKCKISTTSTTPATTGDITISTTTTTTTTTTTDDSNIIINSGKPNMTAVTLGGRSVNASTDVITEDTIPVPPCNSWDCMSAEIRAVIISSLVFIAIILIGCIIKLIKTYCCQHPPKPANI